MLLSFSIRHTHDPVYAMAGAKIHHNTFVYNSRICGGGQVGTEWPAPPLRTSCSRMCALDGIITRKKHPACDMRRQDASKLFYIEFSRISKLNLCLTARITAARMLGMAKLSLEVPSQVHQQAFSLCQMLQILCCGST